MRRTDCCLGIVQPPKRRSKPWLFAEAHELSSVDQVIEKMFRLRGKLTPLENVAAERVLQATGDGIMGFLFVYVHQAQHILDLTNKQRLSDAQLSAWDLPEEAVHELLVASLLAFLGAIPQGISHLRRMIELIVEAAFLSSSYTSPNGGTRSLFTEIYLTDLWQHYTATKPLTAREVIEAVHSWGLKASTELANFNSLCVIRFAAPYCEAHLEELCQAHMRRGLPSPVSIRTQKRDQCSVKNCHFKPIAVVFDRVPNFELMREVAAVILKGAGYSSGLHKRTKELYDKTSSFVHVTRMAHKHYAEWEREDLEAWQDIIRGLIPWLSETLAIMWRHYQIDMPGVLEYLKKIDYDPFAVSFQDLKKSAYFCEAYLRTSERSGLATS